MRNTLVHVIPQLVVLCVLLRSVQAGWVDAERIGLRRASRPVWPYIAAYVAYTAGIEAFNYMRGAIEVTHWSLPPLEIAIRTVGIVVLAPIVEEWIFRGVFLEVLNRRVAFIVANLTQGLAFVLLHLPDLVAGTAPIADGSQVFLDALFFGWMRQRTRSLFPAMAAHAFGNSIAVVERLL